jgi:hypothetical protein
MAIVATAWSPQMVPNEILVQFGKEVLSGGALACLPINLDNYWLNLLKNELIFLDSIEDDSEDFEVPYCAMTAVIKLMTAKHDGGETSINFSDIIDKLGEYYIEIRLEIIRRSTNFAIVPATIDSLFTQRTLLGIAENYDPAHWTGFYRAQ